MKQDKFLTGILIGIAVLIVAALGLFFARNDKREYAAGGEPQDIVHNYVLAVINKDYQKAYDYLADLEHKPTYEDFRQSFFNGMINPGDAGVKVGGSELNDDEAIVTLEIYYANTDPFSSRYSNEDRALLVLQDNEWKISSMPYNFWDFNWYQEPFKP